ncbi:potassium transporter Kup [Micromonospora sp. NPDC005367]|uniref:potassium transporter Kup n=1 Tax=Micromonospora sp. NPDC005367 TaxID=3155590 RepID=UPI0033B360F9
MTERQQPGVPETGPAARPLGATSAAARDSARLALVIGALGVVFGDIGTSPIYAMQTVFNPSDPHPVPISTQNVFGVVSLVFWTVMIIVTVTYVLLALRADNDGEGGIMALITLLRRNVRRGGRAVPLLAALGIFGAALFFGDSMITPAISVLSAVEGLKVVEPSLGELVVPITVVIIAALFFAQRRGSAAVGRLFGPIMIVWFLTVAACGVRGITAHPDILKALSPTYALGFLAGRFEVAFFALAAIVLAVTGAEALYADLGHFGRRSITRAWLVLVFPALALSYLGQGALILKDPSNIGGPFFLLAPDWGRLPLTLLATVATVIASQSVITGAFSVASQAAELGYLPRLRILHTSESTIGQVYVPWVNWLLMVAVLTLVVAYGSSAGLAFAYGMAVTATITISTLLLFYLGRWKWKVPLWLLGLGAVPLLVWDLLLLGANATKLLHGAWVPLLIGLAAFTIMTTWKRGREIVTTERQRHEGSLRDFVEELRKDGRRARHVPGTAIFLNRGKQTVPLAMRANVEHNHVRHEHVVILSIETKPVPRVSVDQRIVVDDLGYSDDGITHVSAYFGYMETPDVPEMLRRLNARDVEGRIEADEASYFLSKIELRAGGRPTMPRWRKRLFITTSFITADAAEHFCLPRDRTVIMGSYIEV